MRTKVTLILLLLNVALLAVILYARREWRVEQDLARAGKRVLGSETIGIRSLTITSPGNDQRVHLEREGDNSPWQIKSPIDWPANDFAIRRIIHELEFLESETSFPVDSLKTNGQSLADYGLNPPRLVLEFALPKSGKPTRLEIGDTTKVGNRLYVLSPDGKTVHVVGRSLGDSLIVGLDDLRTDTLFTIPVFEVRSLGLQNAAPAPRVRLRRDGARWSFEAPIVTRASKADAEVVVSGLNSLRALNFLKDVPLSESGLDKPSLRVTLEGNSRRETLLLGKPYPVSTAFPTAGATLFYARMEDRPQVFVTAIPDGGKGDLLPTLRNAQESLRDTRILDFDPSAVTSISLSAPGRPEPLVLRREDASSSWRIEGAAGAPALPADSKYVGNLVQRLVLLSVMPHSEGQSGFLRDAPSDAEIENYGFNLPQREITLTLARPASSQAPARITLQLGVSGANGGTVQARVLGQPFIYAVSPNTLNDFPVSPAVFRERTLRTLPEGSRITALTLVDTAAPDKPVAAFSLAKDQSLADALAGESPARREALTALVQGLAPLRAAQFVDNTFRETTLVDGHPAPWKYRLEATVTPSAAGAEPQSFTLSVAERSGGGTQLAGSKELGVIFSLEQPVVDALWALTYGPRDPGPPAPAATPAAAP
jgi:hypothetical protein